MKKTVIILLSVFLFFSCRKSDSKGELLDRSPIVVMLCSPNGLGDVNYEDRMYSAVCNMAQENGFRTWCISPRTRGEGKRALLDYMNASRGDGIRRLYIVFSPMNTQLPYIGLFSAALPDDGSSELLVVSPPLEYENVHTADIRMYGMYYTAGMIVAKTFGVEDDLAYCEYDDCDPDLQQAGLGFSCGAADGTDKYVEISVNEECRYDEEWYYNETYLFVDTNILNDNGWYFQLYLTKPMFKATVIRDPETIRNYYTVGVDMDCSMYSDRVMFSCVRHVDRLMELCIGQWMSPEGLPHDQQYGFDSDFAEIVFSPGYDYLRPIADSVYSDAVKKEKEWAMLEE